MAASYHWGEFEEQRSNSSPDDWSLPPSDRDDLIYPQAPRPSVPILYQPSQEETASFQILPPEMYKSDPLVLQTIRLLQHQRQLVQLLARVQSYGSEGCSPPPPYPEDPLIERKAARHQHLNFLPPVLTSFTSGGGLRQKLEIEGVTARLILRKSVATLCAHAGFTDTTESVLKVMSDITHEFLTKFTSVLRSNTDSMLQNGSCPFHDVVEQTLHDTGLGSMNSLHEMYRDRVVVYHARVRQRTLFLHHQYQNIYLQATAREASNAITPSASRRDSLGEGWNEENNQIAANMSASYEDTSLPSVKSSSSLDRDLSLHSFSVLSQSGGDEEGMPNASPQTSSQSIQMYTAAQR